MDRESFLLALAVSSCVTDLCLVTYQLRTSHSTQVPLSASCSRRRPRLSPQPHAVGAVTASLLTWEPPCSMCSQGWPPHSHTVLTPGCQVRHGHALCLSCLQGSALTVLMWNPLGRPSVRHIWGAFTAADAASFPGCPPQDTSARSHFGHPPRASYSYTLSRFPTHHLTQSAFKPISSFILQKRSSRTRGN